MTAIAPAIRAESNLPIHASSSREKVKRERPSVSSAGDSRVFEAKTGKADESGKRERNGLIAWI